MTAALLIATGAAVTWAVVAHHRARRATDQLDAARRQLERDRAE